MSQSQPSSVRQSHSESVRRKAYCDHGVCGKCYKILPPSEKQKCTRQIGLESLAEILAFPCRYDAQGCPRTFNWCDETNHESECPYRTLLDTNADAGKRSLIFWPKDEMSCENGRVRAVFKYEVEENKYANEFKNLRYSLKIRGMGDNVIAIKCNDNRSSPHCEDLKNVELSLEGSIFLGAKPEALYNDIKIESLVPENPYQTLDSLTMRPCSYCKAPLDNKTHNYCLLGHISCSTCREKMCKECVCILDKKSRMLCRNYQRGCDQTLKFDQLHQHQMDCAYNDLKCPLQTCNEKGALPWIKQHLQIDHPDKVIFNTELSRKFSNRDDTVIVVCYDNIFKCVYYYYKTFVEFFVTYVGSSDEAMQFSYEVTVSLDGDELFRRGSCSSWNDVMLQKGITFEKQELLRANGRKLCFDMNIRILN
ncbi:unnamed protein product [Phaedon cochleariae]|uniref:RING-type E3 ubiquitin transferase n=1 Tax=Phaedon cochleariae TaxID=80249 RepID=A0A9N9X5U3_PHACE|nr:unnamed protein product [Phaedon cochleariae]